jgi:hypothetical protein
VLANDVYSVAVEVLDEGEGGVLISANRAWTRENTRNRVIATGEATSTDTPPARGVATDDSPSSPTYYFGPFGRVPMWYASPLLLTDAQAASAAGTILQRQLGTSQSVSFGSYVMPYLEPGDTVRIRRLRSQIDEDHIIDSITIPLSPSGSMSGVTRVSQVTS